MNIDLSPLHSHTTEEIDISGKYEIPKEYYQNSEVVKIDPINLVGSITRDEEDADHIACKASGNMILLDSISLEEVNYPFSFEYDDICE